MTDGIDPRMITDSSSDGEWLLPLQQHKVVMVLDLVESVRLMAQDEAGVVQRWQGFCAMSTGQCCPRMTEDW